MHKVLCVFTSSFLRPFRLHHTLPMCLPCSHCALCDLTFKLMWHECRTISIFSGLYQVCSKEDHIRVMSRWYYDNAILPMCLLSPYRIPIRSRPRYNFSEHVLISPSSAKTIKIASRPYRFLLCSFYKFVLHRTHFTLTKWELGLV